MKELINRLRALNNRLSGWETPTLLDRIDVRYELERIIAGLEKATNSVN